MREAEGRAGWGREYNRGGGGEEGGQETAVTCALCLPCLRLKTSPFLPACSLAFYKGKEPDYLDYNIKGRSFFERTPYNAGAFYLTGEGTQNCRNYDAPRVSSPPTAPSTTRRVPFV